MLDEDGPCAGVAAHVVDAHERARAYEIAAYLSAASFPLDIADGPPTEPVPNPDVALNALVQHGAHALECDRAFLSFIDDRSQFICAEMTRHQSIMDTSPNHSLLLGTSRIDLEWGVCPYTMSVFHGKSVTLPDSPYLIANESYFYIKDFRMVPSFADRPFVAGYPHMVSYMEVPLRSRSGYILGSYCVVDDKERDFLHPNALRTIHESAAAISQYLDLKRTERGRVRSERVMDGLCQFIGSHQPEALDSARTSSPFALDIFGGSQLGLGPHSVENTESGRQTTVENTESGRQTTVENTEADRPDVSTVKGTSTSTTPAHDNSQSTTVSPAEHMAKATEQSLSARIDVLLSKAADMIGHAMNLDGFAFFDAVETGTRYSERPSFAGSSNDAASPRVAKKTSPPAQPLAEYLDGASAASGMTRRPSQSLIRRLTAAYPLGHVFTIDEYGILEQDAQQAESHRGAGTSASYDDCEDLLECIPKARYAIFLPLWHYQRESSYLNCLAWLSDPGKTLEANDINSLTAIGNSLMAEIFRLEAATSTQQKSDFVSSVSHELRSPLHGILATVELMQEQPLDSRLLSMTQMIESCSHTLLDTFDHLLEFSRINSLRKGNESAARAEGDVFSPTTQKPALDLGSVVEEVLHAASLGHNSVSQMEVALKREQQDPVAGAVDHSPLPVLITTHIDHDQIWTSHMDPGIWKRILLNIFSNALRFTTSGHIDVTLGMMDRTDVDPRCLSLTVADSGVGMSREFLKYHLFTPFMQENSLVSGTGLGLHIVKNLVESIHGRMFVESKQHQGTRVTVNIPFDGEPGISGQLDGGGLAPYARTSNLTISLVDITSGHAPEHQTAPHLAPPPKLLQRCLRNICESSLGMTLVDDLPLNELLDKDVVLLDTYSLFSTDVHGFQQRFPDVVAAMASRPFVVLGSSTTGLGKFFRDRGATFVSSPLTRKSLGEALSSALNRDGPAEVMPSPTLDVGSQVSLDPSSTSLLNGADVSIAGTQSVELPVRSVAAAADADANYASQQQSAPLQPPSTPDTNASPQQSPPTPDTNASPQQSPPLQAQSTIDTNDSSPPYSPPFQSPLVTYTNDASPFLQSPSTPTLPYRFTRLLLVDDNPINLKLLAAFAQRTGLAYATACDGAEALRLFTAATAEGKPFDCAFMDISMPVMDGFQATAAIRRVEEERRREGSKRWEGTEEQGAGDGILCQAGRRCYIIALTGLGSQEARRLARDSGFDLFLVKPVKFRSLEPLLRVQ